MEIEKLDLDDAVAEIPQPLADSRPEGAESQDFDFSGDAGFSENQSAGVDPDVDSGGVRFDPEMHVRTLTRDGSWRKKTRNVRHKEILVDEKKTEVAGEQFAALFFSMCESIGGSDFSPTTDERDAVTDAAVRYCKAAGIPDIPPGFVLFLSTMTYLLPRLNAPTRREKIVRWAHGAIKWFRRA